MSKIPQKIKEHLLSLLLVSVLLISVAVSLNPETEEVSAPELYNELYFVDFNDSIQRALLKDILYLYRPEQNSNNDSLFSALLQFNKQQFEVLEQRHLEKTSFSWLKIRHILVLYFKFILIFILVMLLTYYGVQTFGILLFIRKQQQRLPFLIKLKKQFLQLIQKSSLKAKLLVLTKTLVIIGKGLVRAIVYLALFTPAYVMAYSIKSDFNTNSELFLILLAVVSNGLLITYTNKFFTLLISESRKGYVLTARVKNLNNNYFPNAKDGLSYKLVFSIKKDFGGHVFRHIFMNARFQYIETIKEQASFVISGLVIIEMALNIHGQFNYELLQQVLYKNYHFVALMALGLFLLIKLTDIAAEYLKIYYLKKIES